MCMYQQLMVIPQIDIDDTRQEASKTFYLNHDEHNCLREINAFICEESSILMKWCCHFVGPVVTLIFVMLWKRVKFRVRKLVVWAYYLRRKPYWFTEKLAKHCFIVYVLCYVYFWSGNAKLCTSSLLWMMVVCIVSQISHLCHTFLCSVSKTANWTLKCGRWRSHIMVSSIKLSGSWC